MKTDEKILKFVKEEKLVIMKSSKKGKRKKNEKQRERKDTRK